MHAEVRLCLNPQHEHRQRFVTVGEIVLDDPLEQMLVARVGIADRIRIRELAWVLSICADVAHRQLTPIPVAVEAPIETVPLRSNLLPSGGALQLPIGRAVPRRDQAAREVVLIGLVILRVVVFVLGGVDHGHVGLQG
jgi:hypothetical protein